MHAPAAPSSYRTWILLLLCGLLYAALTIAFLGERPIVRAQEARVLETSRQMLDAPGWHGWVIPQLNGEARVRKPPLCYWYTAASFKLLDVSEFAGRLPTLLLGWLTLFVTYCLGRDLLGVRAGLYGAAVLASSFFFLRFAQSAETDLPCVLGTVLACWGIIRGTRGRLAWFHLAAIGITISALSKGGPAIYPLVFLVLYAIVTRSWVPITRFLRSGAAVTAIVLIAPWFIYVLRDPSGVQVTQEVAVVTTGSNHFGLFYEYLPPLLVGLLPWSGFFVLAVLADELRKRPFDETRRLLLCIIACVALPLMVTLNVQKHYLLPLLPGAALLIGWLMREAATTASSRTQSVIRIVFGITCFISLIAGPAALMTCYVMNRTLTPLDVLAAIAISLPGLLMFVVFRRRETNTQWAAWCAMMVLTMPIVVGWWAPTLTDERSDELAVTMRYQYADRPLIVYGDDTDLSLNFMIRRVTPHLHDEAALEAFLASHPDAVVIYQPSSEVPAPLPSRLKTLVESRSDDNVTLLLELK